MNIYWIAAYVKKYMMNNTVSLLSWNLHFSRKTKLGCWEPWHHYLTCFCIRQSVFVYLHWNLIPPLNNILMKINGKFYAEIIRSKRMHKDQKEKSIVWLVNYTGLVCCLDYLRMQLVFTEMKYSKYYEAGEIKIGKIIVRVYGQSSNKTYSPSVWELDLSRSVPWKPDSVNCITR